MSKSVERRLAAKRNLAERTLAGMLRAADVLDRSSYSMDFKIREALEIAVRRAAEVARNAACLTHEHRVGHCEAARAILADAGLDGERRDE